MVDASFTTQRRKVGAPSDTLQDLILAVGEDNPGAITVLANLAKSDPVAGFTYILGLDDMNMRGGQVWIAFKDHCGSDLAKLVECIKARDQAMVDTVNRLTGPSRERAVTGGASFRHL